MPVTELSHNERHGIDPKRVFNLEAFGIATIIASALVMVGVAYSIW